MGPVQGLAPATMGIMPLLLLIFRGWKPIALLNPTFVPLSETNVVGILTIAMDQTSDIFPFKHLPVELQNKVIACAMRATNRKISFSCLTNANFKPNVAVGLLLVK